jgi:hypothetical protein
MPHICASARCRSSRERALSAWRAEVGKSPDDLVGEMIDREAAAAARIAEGK